MNLAPGPLSAPTLWDAVAVAYAGTITPAFEPYALEALALAELEPAACVLDVACGPGTLTFLAAARARHVSAIDFAPQMLAQLRARVIETGARNVDAELMDATALTFHDGTFDGAFCMFGAMFFPDRARGLSEMRRVLRHGRRAVVATWGPVERSPMISAIGEAIRAVMPDLPESPPLPMQTTHDAEAELTAAGFRDVAGKTFTASARFESTDDYWSRLTAAGAPIVMLRKRLGEPAFEDLSHRARAQLRERHGDGPLSLEAEAVITVGVR